MRISDWSSDVCSSDLLRARAEPDGRVGRQPPTAHRRGGRGAGRFHARRHRGARGTPDAEVARQPLFRADLDLRARRRRARPPDRSEEHTSELQSLMRISYAVLCLKKKINTTNNTIKQHHNK